jgi:hypothetical protein
MTDSAGGCTPVVVPQPGRVSSLSVGLLTTVDGAGHGASPVAALSRCALNWSRNALAVSNETTQLNELPRSGKHWMCRSR